MTPIAIEEHNRIVNSLPAKNRWVADDGRVYFIPDWAIDAQEFYFNPATEPTANYYLWRSMQELEDPKYKRINR